VSIFAFVKIDHDTTRVVCLVTGSVRDIQGFQARAGEDDGATLTVISVAAEVELVDPPQRKPATRKHRMNRRQRDCVVKKLNLFGLATVSADPNGEFSCGETVTPEPAYGAYHQQRDKNRAHICPL
jgi:hypothetical protein